MQVVNYLKVLEYSNNVYNANNVGNYWHYLRVFVSNASIASYASNYLHDFHGFMQAKQVITHIICNICYSNF